MNALLKYLRREPLLLVGILLTSGAVWAFVEIADEVTEGDSHAIDERVILSLRNPDDASDPIGPKWFEEMMRDATALGGIAVMVLVSVVSVVFFWVLGNRRVALLLLAALAGGFLLSSGLKVFFDRPRPDLTPHGSFVYTRSFPSGHAMVSACVYLTLGAVLAELVQPRGLRIFLLAVSVGLTIVIGVSRVYLGVHWPTDVLAGWCAGAAWALACWSVAHAMHVRRMRADEAGSQI